MSTKQTEAVAIAEDVLKRLHVGLTPTAAWYGSDAVFELEMDRLFGRAWQLVGTTSGLERPGSYTTVVTDVRREFLVVRGEDGILRAFHNVCRHRANRLGEGSGTCAVIQCSYHGWTYSLDGSLRASAGTGALDRDEYALRRASVDTVGPFLFLNPDPAAAPLAEHLGDLAEQVAALGLDPAKTAGTGQSRVSEYEIRCNWKVAVENSLECYHCPTSHPGLRATLDLAGWQVEMQGARISQGGRLRPPGSTGRSDLEARRLGSAASEIALSTGGNDLAWFHWILPNNSISIWPGPAGSFNIGRWIPLAPDMTRWWRIRYWPLDVPEKAREEQWAFIAQVNEEDKRIVESIQRGMASGAWDGGIFNLLEPAADGTRQQCRDERGPHRFNLLVAEALLRP